jgi:hypothetical protein
VCEVYVGFRPSWTAADITRMASMAERGRGFAILGRDGRVQLVRGLNSARVTEEYLRLARQRKPHVVVYHSRLPTVGDETVANTQPFAVQGRVFGHNGTLPESAVAILRAVTRAPKGASDSAMLWGVLRSLPWGDAVRLLRTLPGRYVLADHRAGRVALIGGWAQTRGDTWGRGMFSWVLLDLRGNVLEETSAPGPWWWRQRSSSTDGLASSLVWPSPKSIV